MNERVDDAPVRDPEFRSSRWRTDRSQCILDLLPVAAMQVHHHDRADAALLAVQGWLRRDSIQCVAELVL